MHPFQTLLKWLLLLSGIFLVSAFAAMFLPRAWMATAHQWLGLGEFPDTPITFYLTRSTSLLYGVHGVITFVVGVTLKHHWRMVPVLGWLHVFMGISIFVIDLLAAMPTYWIAAEGLPVAGLGAMILYLFKRADFSDPQNGLNDETSSV